MLSYDGPISDCPTEHECLAWAHKYLKDCVCSALDEVSLSLGLISVFSWGVAEIPQILTNFREKSTEGISLAFLMTWVLGDIFNLAGCYLEPATLPTQFYMAVLYTITTVILAGQTVYYDYLFGYFHKDRKYKPIDGEDDKPADEERPKQDSGHEPIKPSSGAATAPASINVPNRQHRGSTKDLYYTSARSLASSYTPTVGSYVVGSRESGGQQQSFLRGAHGLQDGSRGSPASHTDLAGSVARTVGASILMVGTVGLGGSNIIPSGSHGYARAGHQVFQTGRLLLQATSSGSYSRRSFLGEGAGGGPWGEIFGWLMAAIYMGGRLPQILLNMKRGTVEGLNPLMFIFALVGNATYVASILVRTMEWSLLKPNLPWLVDAGVCVVLDCFIVGQFVYYSLYPKQEGSSDEEENKKAHYEAIQG